MYAAFVVFVLFSFSWCLVAFFCCFYCFVSNFNAHLIFIVQREIFHAPFFLLNFYLLLLLLFHCHVRFGNSLICEPASSSHCGHTHLIIVFIVHIEVFLSLPPPSASSPIANKTHVLKQYFSQYAK